VEKELTPADNCAGLTRLAVTLSPNAPKARQRTLRRADKTILYALVQRASKRSTKHNREKGSVFSPYFIFVRYPLRIVATFQNGFAGLR
jgi:hypothetical protein